MPSAALKAADTLLVHAASAGSATMNGATGWCVRRVREGSKMNLYLIRQNHNDNWDTYSDAVVTGESEEEARLIHPNGGVNDVSDTTRFSDWSAVKFVSAELVGIAVEGTEAGKVICASFHAG
jgi:hypothetical protein